MFIHIHPNNIQRYIILYVLCLSAKLERYEIFSIMPSSGIIKVVDDIPSDRTSYTLEIAAYDDGSCCGGGGALLHNTTSVTVEIVDSVNHKPVFTSQFIIVFHLYDFPVLICAYLHLSCSRLLLL